MTRSARSMTAAAIVLAGLALAPWRVTAAEPDPDWPCIQRLVPTLAASQMWTGPSVPDAQTAADPGPAGLAYSLASRATPLEQSEAAIDAFAASVPAEDRNAALARLFHDVLALINQERSQIIAGIKRYTRKQRRLAAKITADSQALAGLQPGTVPDPETAALLEARQWDLRVFEDRQRAQRQICDQPVQLDQRAFAVARALQARLVPN